MNLENEIQKIINAIDPSWNQLEVVRFVYIEVGKIIEKNTEFFFTQSNKLQKNALSEEEMTKINNVTLESICENDKWYRVICRSAAILLKEIYDRLNIPSHLIKSYSYAPLMQTSDEFVFHWRLSVDINDTHYSLVLASDLSNIKNGFATEHFATRLDYYNAKGEQLYQGEKLDFTVLSHNELEEIDKKIGYINTYYPDGKKFRLNYNDKAITTIRRLMKDNGWYYRLYTINSNMYNALFAIVDEFGNVTDITTLDNKTIFTKYSDQLIKNVCIQVESTIKIAFGLNIPLYKFENYEDWQRKMCILLEDDLIDTYGEEYRDIIEVKEDFNYKNWRKRQKSVLKCPYKSYDDYLELMDQIDLYVNTIRKLKEEYIKGSISSSDSIRNIRRLHIKICEHFLPDYVIFEKNIELVNGEPYIKSDYINNKFKVMFPLVFNTSENLTEFNKMSYSEQIATINKILPNIFPEITINNTSQVPAFSSKYNPTLIRIRTYCIYNENTKEYELIFHIPSFYEFEDEYYYLYNLRDNTFRQIDIIEDIYNKKYYEILSSTLKDKFKDAENASDSPEYRDIEEIEEQDERKFH